MAAEKNRYMWQEVPSVCENGEIWEIRKTESFREIRKSLNERWISWNPGVLGRLGDSRDSENFGDLGHSEGLGDSED